MFELNLRASQCIELHYTTFLMRMCIELCLCVMMTSARSEAMEQIDASTTNKHNKDILTIFFLAYLRRVLRTFRTKTVWNFLSHFHRIVIYANVYMYIKHALNFAISGMCLCRVYILHKAIKFICRFFRGESWMVASRIFFIYTYHTMYMYIYTSI